MVGFLNSADRERMYYSDEEDESRPQKKWVGPVISSQAKCANLVTAMEGNSGRCYSKKLKMCPCSVDITGVVKDCSSTRQLDEADVFLTLSLPIGTIKLNTIYHN